MFVYALEHFINMWGVCSLEYLMVIMFFSLVEFAQMHLDFLNYTALPGNIFMDACFAVWLILGP